MTKPLRIVSGLWVLMLAAPAIAQVPEGLSGTLIVLNKSGNDASFIDLASGETVATLPTGNDPHELVVTDDGRWAIGTNFRGGNSLTVFDLQDLSVDRTIDLSDHPQPHGLREGGMTQGQSVPCRAYLINAFESEGQPRSIVLVADNNAVPLGEFLPQAQHRIESFRIGRR
jgi:hypothetical protein